MMKIKNVILPVALVVLIGGYMVYRQFSGSPAPLLTANNDQNPAGNEVVSPMPNPSPTPTPTPTTQLGYKDGQYTGAVANTIYGDIQVKAVISGGKITSIQMLKAPTAGGHTAELVASSFPVMVSEAIKIQSEKVHNVSGATQNVEGFVQSLASALSKAV